MNAVPSDSVVMPASAIQQYSNKGSGIGLGRTRVGVLAPDALGVAALERTPTLGASGAADRVGKAKLAGRCE